MDELYAGGLIFGAFAAMVAVFMGGYSIGKYDGKSVGEVEMRPKVVLYCVEKPDLCKTEYNNIKTQNKLNDYQKPEIK
jgi:hypothetical protein